MHLFGDLLPDVKIDVYMLDPTNMKTKLIYKQHVTKGRNVMMSKPWKEIL